MAEMHEARRRSHAVLCVVLLLGVACVLHHEVLFGGQVYHMDDAADGYYPGHIAVARAFAHGELPSWERGTWAGWPLVVDPYNGTYYPLNIVYYALGAARGLGCTIALHVFLAGLGMWLLLRRRGLGDGAALFGALALELSSFGVVRIRHVIFVQTMAWMPWILLGVERYLATRRRRELAGVALATGLALLAGGLSIGHFAVLAVAGYTLGRCWPDDDRAGDGRSRWRRFLVDGGALAGAAIGGALIAAAQILPTLAHLPHSPRALASDYAFASSYAWPDVRWLGTLLMPDFFGGEDRAHYVGAPNHWELAGWYVGALCALLAPLGLLGRRRRAERMTLAALGLLAIGLAFGDAGPVHPFFYRHVPLYAALRCPARALFVLVVALPILGAHGVAWLAAALGARAERSLTKAGSRWVTLCLVGATVAMVVGAATWLRLARPALRDVGDQAALAATQHLVAVLAAALAAIALACAWRRRTRLALPLLLGAVLVGDLITVDRGYVALYHEPADYPAGMERFAAVEWLLEHGGPPQEGRFTNDPRGPFRLHNLGMVLGLESPAGYDSVPIWRQEELLYLMNTGHRYPHKELRDDLAAVGTKNLGSPLLNLMNVRWLLAAAPPPGTGDDPPANAPRWVERFSPRPPTGSPAARYQPYWDNHLKVYENLHVLPRAFLVHRAEVPGSDDALAARLADSAFDAGRVALLETALPSPLTTDAAPGAARLVEAGRTHLVIDTDDPLPALLVVSEADYPGWRVTVDGQPAELLRADWAFRGVALSAGRHRVEMRYRSAPVELGLLLSALGLALALALVMTDRRQAGRSEPDEAGIEGATAATV